jgi:hypothetical protein
VNVSKYKFILDKGVYMKKRLLIISFLFFQVAFGTKVYGKSDEVFFIGLDNNGADLVKEVTPKRFKKKLVKVMDEFTEAVIPSLNKNMSNSNDWNFSKLKVGASINATVGLGALVKAKTSPTFFLIFSRK